MAEFVFQGTSALTLDAKGRINVPARHRDALASGCKDQVTLIKNPIGCLIVLPRPVWESFRARLTGLPMEAEDWLRIYVGSAHDVEIDSASRLHVSPELRADAGLVRDVLLIGMGSRLELWDAARHAAHEAAVKQRPMPDAVKNFVF